MSISVKDLMLDADLGATTFTRKRPAVTLAKEGQAVATYTDTTLTGLVQPAQQADANLLPEGVRLVDTEAFYTAGNLSVGDGAATLPDVIVYGSVKYRVLHVQDFSQFGYVRALAQRFTPGGT